MDTVGLKIPNKLFKAFCNQNIKRFALGQTIDTMILLEKYRDYIAYQHGMLKPLPVYIYIEPEQPDNEFQWFFSKVNQIRSCPLSSILEDCTIPKLKVNRADKRMFVYLIDLA